jgi:2-polyprenyl-3-methyl-5-hydroxy-6-metoxy-1,4-benzoquinol methylase
MINDSGNSSAGNTPDELKKVEAFFNMWTLYEKVILHNYMYHREITAALDGFIKRSFSGGSFSFLDLGSGDASFISKVLSDKPVSLYSAFDLSETAITKAEENFKSHKFNKNFTQCNFLEGLQKNTNKYDIIWSCFSLHHFQSEQKAMVFSLCEKTLKNNGFFCLTDICRADGTTREEYQAKYLEHKDSNWKELTDHELKLGNEHITTSDFPETISSLYKMGTDCGFQTPEILYQEQFHMFLCFPKR